MNVLILGSGGREHAFAWKLKQSKQLNELFIAPGNGGTSALGTNVSLKVDDFEAIAVFCISAKVNMIVVGPEIPLVKGIYDYFTNDSKLAHISIIGPSKEGAKLEGSKAFAKEFMMRHNIPTAFYSEFNQSNLAEGLSFIDNNEGPYVLKADGLAAGKGVVIETDAEKAKAELSAMIADQKFGEASSRVIIEEFLDGIEFSVFAVSDGTNYVLLPNAKDYKRIGEGDTGLNTGGMGAISPVPFVDETIMEQVKNQVIEPTIRGLKEENIIYKGFIYFGFILVKNKVKVIEYNCRMGDPETEIVLPRLKSDLLEILDHCAKGTLNEIEVEHIKEAGATVVLVSGGYPEAYEKGKVINLPSNSDSIIFHAGTIEKNGQLLSNGGRVLAISSFGTNVSDAVSKSIAVANNVSFEGKNFRKDIGYEFK